MFLAAVWRRKEEDSDTQRTHSLYYLQSLLLSSLSFSFYLRFFFFLLLKIDEECKIDALELVMSTTLGGVLLQENDQ